MTIKMTTIQKIEMKFNIICTKPISDIPITTNISGEKRSYMRFKGDKKTIKAITPYVLSKTPVISEVNPMSDTFSGKAKANVPLLIISAKAANEACSTKGCFNNGVKSATESLPLSVETNDSFTYLRIKTALIINKMATNIKTYSTLERAAIAPPKAGPIIAAAPIHAPVSAIDLPLDPSLD